MRHPAQGATGGRVMPGLLFTWFPLCEFYLVLPSVNSHYLILPVENSERDGNTNHLTCLLRNLYAGQEATVRTGHGTTDWFQIGKGTSMSRLYVVTLVY